MREVNSLETANQPPPSDPAVSPAPPAPVASPSHGLAGKALAAVTGIFPTKPITREQGKEAEQLIAKATKLIAKFCKFGDFADFRLAPKFDFEATYADLGELTEAEAAVATEDLAAPDVIAGWKDSVNASRAYLKTNWPVAIRQTPTGPTWVEPSMSEGGRIAEIIAVVEDPLELLTQMNRGALAPSLIDAVRACHAELFERFLAIFEATLRDAGEKKRVCPWSHELPIRMLFGLAPDGLVTFTRGGAPTPAPSGGGIDIKFDDLQTKSQSVR